MTETVHKNRPYVFLSYSHDDRVKVEKICERFRAAGFECWIDAKIRAMENFNEVIEDAIEGCELFVCFFSKSYAEKPYCQLEHDCAVNNNRSRMIVCIDDVKPRREPGKKYIFSYYTGLSCMGFGTGVSEDDADIESFADQMMNSPRFDYLRRYMNGEEAEYMPPRTASEELIACIRSYTERQYHQQGNYVFSEINRNLFPGIIEKDESRDNTPVQVRTGRTGQPMHRLYADAGRQQVSLVKYLTDTQQEHCRNIFLTGEGGNGKTVSLLQTCEYLLDQGRCAIYIPIKMLGPDMDIDEYVYKYIFGRSDSMKAVYDALLRANLAGGDNVIFLLDGVNEVEVRTFKKIASDIRGQYIDPGLSARFIITSRFDARKDFRLTDFVLLELQPLDEMRIAEYLENCGLNPVTDAKLLSVIRTPLLLTLYADTERYREQYQQVELIELDPNPDTPGKILGNFIQTQLYRASEEVNFDLAEQMLIMELLLPLIAYRMTRKPNGFLDYDEAMDCVDEIDRRSELFEWYRKSRLRKLKGKKRMGDIDLEYLFGYAEEALHFIYETDAGYEFIHQSFRDYFAACHVVNEIRAIHADSDRIDELEPAITQSRLADDILRFAADIIGEEDAEPRLTESGWVFPGKTGTGPSEFSCAEQVLDFWRNQEDNQARYAVYNLVSIMRIGRNGMLAWCDFSNLDLRKCWLNKCRFVEWYEDKVYPSIFDGAWIDRSVFISSGHETTVTAVCTDGRRLFSGNLNGTVKIYDLEKESWVLSIQPDNSPVTDMAWDAVNGRLAIMYSDVVFCYCDGDGTVSAVFANENRFKAFRYIRFLENGDMQVAYDLEPLTWYNMDGTAERSGLDYDVPAKCARWNPARKQFIHSNLLQLVSVEDYNEESGQWEAHPVLKRRLEEENRRRRAEGRGPVPARYLSLREDGAEEKDSVNCIEYNADGSRFLIGIQNILMEYDTETLTPVRRKMFTAHVECACYSGDMIVVGSGTTLYVLDEDFSERLSLQGTQIKPIGPLVESYDGDGYYLISYNGEFKKLDQDLVVRRIRTVRNRSSFVWARDRRTGRMQIAFQPDKNYTLGMRYTYETGQQEPLGWCYEFVDTYQNNDEQRIYRMQSRLMCIERKPPYEKIIYENYTGIWIFECSFKNIRGDLADAKNREFIHQNGGLTDGNAE